MPPLPRRQFRRSLHLLGWIAASGLAGGCVGAGTETVSPPGPPAPTVSDGETSEPKAAAQANVGIPRGEGPAPDQAVALVAATDAWTTSLPGAAHLSGAPSSSSATGTTARPASTVRAAESMWLEETAVEERGSATAAAEVEVVGLQAPDMLAALESLAVANNPSLRRLRHEADAALARAAFADKLPDPVAGANVFTEPIETAAGAQRANLSLSQMIPWLARLDAQQREACLQAMAARREVELERLRLLADVRSAWYRLFVIEKQLATNRASGELLEELVRLANQRLALGRAGQADVLLGTVELARLEEQRVALQQQRLSLQAELNRLIGRDAETAIEVPDELDIMLPEWSPPMLFGIARQAQPAIEAARLRAQASRWGIEVARLRRRPDVTVSASWFAIDDNRPTPNVVEVGEDAFALGANLSLPLWRSDYDSILHEAVHESRASQAEVQSLLDRYQALIVDLWAQAKAAAETAQLFADTIIPQARRSLEADQKSYAADAADFDRLISDYRNLLAMELEYHRAVGRLAIALARIRQAVGADLSSGELAAGNGI